MDTDSTPVHSGMTVVGCDGREVGKVGNVHSASFTIKRAGRLILSLPLDVIEESEGARVVLRVMADQVDQLGGTHESATSGAGAAFRCPYCSTEFQEREQRNEHVRAEH
ncbi:MAG: DUF2171 domain-containing protein [Chloroflexota bacterium]|nr:DUF2171 domain-containing protein [Chloroflexota bacterium]